MIVFSLGVVVPLSRRTDLLESLGGFLEPTRVVPGSIACRLLTDSEDSNAFTLLEEWASQADLDRHLGTDAFKTLVAAMEMSAKPPRVQFDSVSKRGGIEVIEAARRAQGLLYSRLNRGGLSLP